MLIQMSEEIRTSEDKNDSEMCHMSLSEQAETIVKELNSMHGQAKKKIEELIQQLKEDKLKDHEIKQVLFSRVNFVSKRTLYRALPEDLKREYTKPLPKTINITTEHKVIEQSEREPISPVEFKKPEQKHIPVVDLVPNMDELAKTPYQLEHEGEESEDPQALEIQFLKEKVTELEDALKKTQQFKPATALTIGDDNTDGLNWLQKRADGIHSFYYDTYGIDLFRNRELSQLKNSGVKVFKRLYFEV